MYFEINIASIEKKMKISTISDIVELENIECISPIYIMDVYSSNPAQKSLCG